MSATLDPDPSPDQPGAPVDAGVAAVVAALQERLDALPAVAAPRRAFLGAYVRMTTTIGRAVAAGAFEDPAWVRRWDVAFAGRFLAAHDADARGERPPRPWRLAIDADPRLPVLVHLLLALNAHVNYDLPQAVLAVVDDDDFAHPVLMATRRRDHERIDAIIASRVAAEGELLPRGLRALRPVLAPLDRWSAQRFLPRARQQVWANAYDLHEARSSGPGAYADRVSELDVLTAARVAGLVAPGPVLLRLAASGFGVRLPPP